MPRREVWYKTTIESQSTTMDSHYEGTGPIWNRICPYCDEWWNGFRDQSLGLIELGLDGYQLDTIGVEGALCFASNHGHIPGAGQLGKLVERLTGLRQEIHHVKPDFLFAGEQLRDWQFQSLDLSFSRYRKSNGPEVFRYAFPETKEHAAVGAYSYDQANKSLILGLAMNVEVYGIKKSILIAPDFADYLGGIVQIRRAHAAYLMNGRFRDTIGATINGDLAYGVFEGPGGNAVVLWNSHDHARTVVVSIDGVSDAILCLPQESERIITLPAHIEVDANRALAIIPRR